MNENNDDASNLIVKNSAFVTKDSYLEDYIENRTENIYEKVDGDSKTMGFHGGTQYAQVQEFSPWIQDHIIDRCFISSGKLFFLMFISL